MLKFWIFGSKYLRYGILHPIPSKRLGICLQHLSSPLRSARLPRIRETFPMKQKPPSSAVPSLFLLSRRDSGIVLFAVCCLLENPMLTSASPKITTLLKGRIGMRRFLGISHSTRYSLDSVGHPYISGTCQSQ
ncbi:uncharacterized protein BDR25DRAFT_355316 [Lindgomyces ingoldianus]|uniref:Uncharacterized protein n=1 Tax=Lindgomyces ingoldianus TaxID=673940 RepID=A0ACB6QXA2_9PLEO|nr:uncharacterized protein BDR25DRAFT_355316 [Lindgomyces ingoldianus]KAF2470826.1 hypothetical protein BDR25DRAFT_355316 [Lindgomyces ingoldianus]